MFVLLICHLVWCLWRSSAAVSIQGEVYTCGNIAFLFWSFSDSKIRFIKLTIRAYTGSLNRDMMLTCTHKKRTLSKHDCNRKQSHWRFVHSAGRQKRVRLHFFSVLTLSHPFFFSPSVLIKSSLLWRGRLNSLLLPLPPRSADRSAQCKLCRLVIAWCWKSISCLNPGVFLRWPEPLSCLSYSDKKMSSADHVTCPVPFPPPTPKPAAQGAGLQ